MATKRKVAPKAAGTTPAVLLPYQQAWIADKAKVTVWEKSRRIGASWCDAADSVLMASAQKGQDALYIGYAQDMTREYIEDCAMWAKAFNVVAGAMEEGIFFDSDDEGNTREIKTYRIDFSSGNKILALSSRPRSIRGKQGKITIDEAAFHDDLPGLLKAALALLIWGGRVRVLSSHNGAENPFNVLVQDIRAGRLPYSLHRTTLDDALAQGLYRRVCLKLGTAWSAAGEVAWREELLGIYRGNEDEELFCIPRDGSGAWLTRVLIEACMYDAPILRWKPPAKDFVHWPEHQREAEVKAWCEKQLGPLLEALDKSLTSFLGEDFARHMDLSVIAPVVLERNLTRRVPFLVELADCPFEQQKQIFFYIADRLPRFRKGFPDAGGNGSYLAEVAMQRYGSRIEPIVFNVGWYRDNTAPFKAAFEDKTILIPRDRDVLDDLRAFEVVRGIPCMPELRRKDADGQVRHGDAGIALLLAYQASRSDFVPCDEWQSTGVARASGQYQDYFPA